jgi:hypothetical protein
MLNIRTISRDSNETWEVKEIIFAEIWDDITPRDRTRICQLMNIAEEKTTYHPGLLGICDVGHVLTRLFLLCGEHSVFFDEIKSAIEARGYKVARKTNNQWIIMKHG